MFKYSAVFFEHIEDVTYYNVIVMHCTAIVTINNGSVAVYIDDVTIENDIVANYIGDVMKRNGFISYKRCRYD